MENTKDKSALAAEGQNDNIKKKHRDTAKIIGLTAGGIVLAVVLFFVGVTIYLTPDRLKKIISEEGSRYLAADVRVGSVGYSLWSSFPNLRVYVDSLIIDSRTLDAVPSNVSAFLPNDSKRLMSVSKFSGAINLWNALRGDIALKDIQISRPECNIVIVNDSVNNFDIFSKINKDLKIPHISLNKIEVAAPMKISFLDLQSQTHCNAVVKGADLKFIEGKTDNYVINLVGDIDFKSKDLSTVKSIPFNVGSQIAMGFSPLTVTVPELKAEVADLKTITNVSLIAGKQFVVSKLNLDLSCSDLLTLGKYFSFHDEANLNVLKGELPVYARLNLASPYEVPGRKDACAALPSFTLSINVPGGEADCRIGNNKTLNLQDIALQADLNIDPSNPEASVLLVPMLTANTEGASIEATGTISELMSGDPLLDADIKCVVTDLSKTYGKLVSDNKLKIAGSLNGTSSISCRLSGLRDKKISDLKANGDIIVTSLKVSDAVEKLSANLQDLSLKLRASVPYLSTSSMGSSQLNMVASSSKGKVTAGNDSTAISFKDMTLNGLLSAKGSVSNPKIGGKVNLNAGNFNASSSGIEFDANDIGLLITAALRSAPWSDSSGYSTSPSSSDDSIISHRVRHSPQYLVLSLPDNVRNTLSMLNLDADVTIGRGVLLADGYPVRNNFSDVDLSTNLDTMIIRNMNLATRGSEAFLKGKVYGLRGFLISPVPAPLTVNLDAHFNDVDINQLSGNYYAGQSKLSGKPADYVVPPLGPYTKADSLCVLIPRNLFADLRLHSDRAEYMGWQFSPLSTEITLHDGVAKIGKLTVGADYGSVVVDWTYSTSDLHDIFMQLDADINDFEVDKFFHAFPMITKSASEISNLSGTISAEAKGRFLMFPNMFVNAPSMTAEANLHTSGVEYEREGKIKRITNLMLLRGDTPLKINDLDIHASFHDNLLQLDPFTVDCGTYRLGIAGVNNLQGEMYYHLGVHGSPLHMPFGVNFVGNWHHPSIRFGGANIHDGREREISSNLKDDVHVNIMRELKHGWLLFVENAAKYDAENNQQYVFNVE